MSRQRLLLVITALVILASVAAIFSDIAHAPKASPSHTIAPAKPVGFNKHAYSTAVADSPWVIVNKQHPLKPSTYVPAQLVVPNIPLRSNITGDERQVSSVMAPSLEAMIAAAKAAGVTLTLQSGYRSYGFQVSLYNSYVKNSGQAAADRFSARPSYSEHQTGLAADLGGVTTPGCNVEQCFDSTPEGKWLTAHSYEYGFIIRYPSGKESITGYESEPWHVRYVGKDLSVELHNQGIETLEEFFGITGGTSY